MSKVLLESWCLTAPDGGADWMAGAPSGRLLRRHG
jgi:hypothetical protein